MTTERRLLRDCLCDFVGERKPLIKGHQTFDPARVERATRMLFLLEVHGTLVPVRDLGNVPSHLLHPFEKAHSQQRQPRSNGAIIG